jgi:hypothetical protein
LGFQRTNGLRGKDNQIYRVTAMETDTPVFQPRGDALFNVSDSVLRGAENDITSLEEASSGAFSFAMFTGGLVDADDDAFADFDDY